ncbi:hypothetical protein J3U37_12060 [Gilliamella sp. B3172]|uniref:hypothetical protein n=1 Tax=Gilliamella sp. B3172 TaxID=2818006 RepID=UPI00226AB0E8|nr:hypothetical protein [Gilliamella sp. B3172]MCX8640841.1 hypothetical protein [Gilliamella sp. B3172]
MPNENTQKCKVFTAQTSKLENGEVAVEEIILENVPIPLFVLFAYGGTGAEDFLRAAEFKKQRLQFKYPDAEVRIIKGFEHPPQFKAEWTKLYNELTNSETACKYALWQVHYFGHGDIRYLTFRYDARIYFNEHDNMKRLPWHPNEGIFVLHSCRGAAYEDTRNKKDIENQSCLANTISILQQTRCLGQVTYGNFNALDIITDNNKVAMPLSKRATIFYPKNKWEADIINKAKYRSHYAYNYAKNYSKKPVVLWGYALLTNDTKERTLYNKQMYENNKKIQNSSLPKLYPIYQEMEKLAGKNQILPCRVFNNGKLEERIVEVDVFNQNDLEYI